MNIPRFVLCVATVYCGVLLILNTCPVTVAAAETLTSDEIQSLVNGHLSRKPDYQPGDLIYRDDVEPIFNALLARGIKPVDNEEELYDSFLPPQDRLVRLLASPAGKAFMRRVNRLPGAYDKLERLSWLKGGRELLEELISDPKGADVFARLITPEGIKVLEQQFASDPRGRNFSRPTGRIHTEAQLIARLEKLTGPKK